MKLKEASKEKESMVMRYAKSEQEILKVRKEMEALSRHVQNLTKEVETLNKKNKMLGSERERLINMVDAKVMSTCLIVNENMVDVEPKCLTSNHSSAQPRQYPVIGRKSNNQGYKNCKQKADGIFNLEFTACLLLSRSAMSRRSKRNVIDYEKTVVPKTLKSNGSKTS